MMWHKKCSIYICVCVGTRALYIYDNGSLAIIFTKLIFNIYIYIYIYIVCGFRLFISLHSSSLFSCSLLFYPCQRLYLSRRIVRSTYCGKGLDNFIEEVKTKMGAFLKLIDPLF